MKFIHLADAHLDSPFLGLSFLPSNQFNRIKASTQASFTRIVDDAIENQVDLVLIAGDTFDSTHPSPQNQIFFNNQIKRLIKHKIQTVMILGNHDYISPDNLLLPHSPYFKLLGKDQSIEKVEYRTKSGFNYRVVGFSYQQNHIEMDKIPEFLSKNDQIFTFGLMHAGQKVGNKNQDTYAPFTLSEVKDLNYDYFALGHIHLRQTLSRDPLIVYSGNIQGRHINESGAKGYLLGEVDESDHQIDLEFIPTSEIVWQKVKISLDQAISQTDLIQLIQDTLNKQSNQETLFALEISGAQFLSEEELEFINDAESWAQISQDLAFNSQLVKVYLEENEVFNLNAQDQAAFNQAKEEVLTSDSLKKLGRTLLKKDANTSAIFEDANFLKEVQNLAEVKLGRELKGFNDEIK